MNMIAMAPSYSFLSFSGRLMCPSAFLESLAGLTSQSLQHPAYLPTDAPLGPDQHPRPSSQANLHLPEARAPREA